MMEEKEKKETLSRESKIFRDNQIQMLEAIENRSDMQQFMLDLFKKENEKSRTDKEVLRDNYYKIINEYDYWMDLRDEYRNIATLWVIGTYLHNQFITFPVLYLNAMRGSGKSRFLNLSSNLSNNGTYIHSNLTEAVAFRTHGSLFIDEFESIGSKEKQTLRELLNSAYKKGTKVLRMKEIKTLSGKDYKVQEFEVYRPVCLANIWGMDEVLSDRCITMVLEKSNDPLKTNLVENFEFNKNIKIIKSQFIWCSLCSVVSLQDVYSRWNEWVKDKTTLHTNYTNYTNYIKKEDLIKNIELDSLFNKIDNSGITGRNLEIFMPLFIIAKIIGDDILDYTIKTASKMVSERKHEEEMESKDVLLYDFISKLDSSLDYYPIRQLTIDFRNYIGSSEEWLNDKWFGRALKRLNLVIEKKRKSSGIEVMLNVTKAKEKIKMFRTGEEKNV